MKLRRRAPQDAYWDSEGNPVARGELLEQVSGLPLSEAKEVRRGFAETTVTEWEDDAGNVRARTYGPEVVDIEVTVPNAGRRRRELLRQMRQALAEGDQTTALALQAEYLDLMEDSL